MRSRFTLLLACRLAVIGGAVIATELVVTHWFFARLLTGELQWWVMYAVWLTGFGSAAALAAAWLEGWAEELIEKGVIYLSPDKAKSRLGAQAKHSPHCVARGTEKDAGAGSFEGGTSSLTSSQS